MISFLGYLLAVMFVAFSMNGAFSESNEEDTILPDTEALGEKWRSLFHILDTDKNGVYTLEEKYSVFHRLLAYYHPPEELKPGLEQYSLLYKDVIEAYFGVDTAKTGLTQSEFVTAHIWYWSNHYDLFKRRLYAYYTALFHTMDSDNDGIVSFEEFQYYYTMLGDKEAIKQKARKAFERIDGDADGVISEDEFRDIFLIYLLDPDVTAKELPLT